MTKVKRSVMTISARFRYERGRSAVEACANALTCAAMNQAYVNSRSAFELKVMRLSSLDVNRAEKFFGPFPMLFEYGKRLNYSFYNTINRVTTSLGSNPVNLAIFRMLLSKQANSPTSEYQPRLSDPLQRQNFVCINAFPTQHRGRRNLK